MTSTISSALFFDDSSGIEMGTTPGVEPENSISVVAESLCAPSRASVTSEISSVLFLYNSFEIKMGTVANEESTTSISLVAKVP